MAVDRKDGFCQNMAARNTLIDSADKCHAKIYQAKVCDCMLSTVMNDVLFLTTNLITNSKAEF